MMSADIGVHWRSAVCGSESHSRSPSLSALPPLPDLIPIRKGNAPALIRNFGDDLQQSSRHVVVNGENASTAAVEPSPNAVAAVKQELVSSDCDDDEKSNAEQSEKLEKVISRKRNCAEACITNAMKSEPNGFTDNDDDDDGCGGAGSVHATATDMQSNSTVVDAASIASDKVCQSDANKCRGVDNGVYGFNDDDDDDMMVDSKEALANRLKFNGKENSQSSNGEPVAAKRPKIGAIAPPPAKSAKCENQKVNPAFRRTTRSALDNYENRTRNYSMTSVPVYSLATVLAANKQEERRNNRIKMKNRAKNLKVKSAGGGAVTKKRQQPNKVKSKNAALALARPKQQAAALAASTGEQPTETRSKINPIFLFVKQDDTRIIEVRCEDYDKRNRIRLTKTANGWRATPRTDVESSSASPKPVDAVTETSSVALPKVTATKEESKKSKNKSANADWRVNPFSQNRIRLSKQKNQSTAIDCELNNNNNNNDEKFDSCATTATTDSSSIACNAELSSGIDTSASIEMHFTNESSATSKKHKKKKKKKKSKHKLKMGKVAVGAAIASSQPPKQTSTLSNQNASDDEVDIDATNDGGGVAHASATPTAATATNRPSVAHDEVKFTIRLKKNGESTIVAKTSEKKATKNATSVVEEQIDGRGVQQQQQREAVHEKNSDRVLQLMKMYMCNNAAAAAAAVTAATTTTTPSTPCTNSNDTVVPFLHAKKEIVTPAVSPTYSPSYPSSPALPMHHGQPEQSAMQSSASSAPSAAAAAETTTTTTMAPSTRSTNGDDVVVPFLHAKKETLEPPERREDTVSPDCATVRIEPFVGTKPVPVKSCNATPQHQLQQQQQQNNNNNRISIECSGENTSSEDCVNLLSEENSFYVHDDDEEDIVGVRVGNNNNNNKNFNLSSNNEQSQMHHHDHHQHDLPSDYHDLIAGIRDIHDTHDDILDQCGDNTMTGAELLDSLVERGCEVNNISGDSDDIKDTICLSDDYNDEAANQLLLDASQPVADILSRLNSDAMAAAAAAPPKCLSFNDAGEIESLHESLFSTTHSKNSTPFNHAALEELSLTLKGLEKQSTTATIVSPDSCEDLPKDLSFKKKSQELASALSMHHRALAAAATTTSPRPISRSSDAIQSPQPSGLPAVPPSPDILMALHQQHNGGGKNQSDNNANEMPSRNSSLLKRTLQKEPLDLHSKHRKSASPTVSCSSEVHRLRRDAPNGTDAKSVAKDPDPLTQLRLLISNPEWNLPDPILVPKSRLNAVLASPAREIPLLLTTRPELRLPDAFEYPSILQDPDILVISFSQLETIIKKQSEFLKESGGNGGVKDTESPKQQQLTPSNKQHQQQREQQQHKERSKSIEKPHEKLSVTRQTPTHHQQQQQENNNNNNLAGDINSATIEAINQMLWLPYLNQMGQMGQLTPELLKALPPLASSFGIQDANAFAALNRFAAMQSNPMSNFGGNSLELAMWQEALANSAGMQRLIKMNAEQQAREAQRKVAETKRQQAETAAALRHSQQNQAAAAAALYLQQQQQQQQQQQHQQHQKLLTSLGLPAFLTPNLANNSQYYQNLQNRSQQSASKSNVPQQFSPPIGFGKDSGDQQRSSCKQKPNASFFGSAAMNNLHNFANLNQMNKLGMAANAANLRKARKEQQAYQQQQQQQQHQSNEKPRVHVKSLMNLLQQPDYGHGEQMRSPRTNNNNTNENNAAAKMSNLMTMPTFDLTSPPATPTTSNHQPKLKVKPGLHLLDPMAMQRRFLANATGSSGGNSSCEDSPEVGSTTNGIEEIMMNNANMHNPQSNYSSPWHWTTVTATGE